MLADQHDGLMEHAAGARPPRRGRHPGHQRDQGRPARRPAAPAAGRSARSRDADEEIPEALGLLISFPFPIESNDIVHGDYANTSIVFSIDLDNLYKNFLGGDGTAAAAPPLPDLPGLPDLPDLPDLPGRARTCPDVPAVARTSPRPAGLLGRGATTSGSGYATDLDELLGGGGHDRAEYSAG